MNDIRATIADLIVDIRFNERRLKVKFTPEEFNYMESCRHKVGCIFSSRHTPDELQAIIKGGSQ